MIRFLFLINRSKQRQEKKLRVQYSKNIIFDQVWKERKTRYIPKYRNSEELD